MNKSIKARKYNSAKLQELFDEITPVEMEQTKVKMQLAIRIEDLMRAKNLNKSQFAEKVGKHSSEITKWLSGTHNFTIDILTEIAFALEVDISNLTGKKQIEVIYRKEIVVKSVVAQPSIILTTPIDQNINRGRKLLSSSQQSSIPYSKIYQA